MRITYFTHSLSSCWNHGNAHFLRGLLCELALRGHSIVAYEPADGWSRRNLQSDHGTAPLYRFASEWPQISNRLYGQEPDAAAMVQGADLVIVHEWTDPWLVAAIGGVRKRNGRFVLLFHDTHHRALSDPRVMRQLDLSGFDGVLAFGESLAEVYRRDGWGSRAFVFHEAADTRVFRPLPDPSRRTTGVVWIGNWGDDERTQDLTEYLLRPARAAGQTLDIHGVRYPEPARDTLAAYGARYHGWIANADVPAVFARHAMTVHVPRRWYRTRLPGIPTIRVFEALACGVPLLCAPWSDDEGLFTLGRDFLVARDGEQMTDHMRRVAADPDLRQELASSGLKTIQARHTCRHRADELLAIASKLQPQLAGAA